MPNATVLLMLAGLGTSVLLLAGLVVVVYAGVRAGDRPNDARVSAWRVTVHQPDGAMPVVLARVENPGPVPVVVGMSLRPSRQPEWFDGAVTVLVPHWTTRKRLRAEQQAVVGVVDSGAHAEWSLPVPHAASNVHLVAVLGQGGRRLRVIDRPVGSAAERSAGELPGYAEGHGHDGDLGIDRGTGGQHRGVGDVDTSGAA